MKSILVSIPELSYSGSPYSAYRICRSLKDIYNVTLISYADGSFRKEFEKESIPVKIVDKNSIYNNEELIDFLMKYDLLIANTIIVYAIADIAKNIIPTIWYIREAQNLSWQFFKFDYRRYYALQRAENIYAVSEYAADYIRTINQNVQVIHNCVEDVYGQYRRNVKEHTRIHFLMLGTLEPRKAFDVAVNAVKNLPVDLQSQCDLAIAGRIMDYAKEYADNLLKIIHETDGIHYLGEIQDRDTLMQLIADSDVVIVPSKDESCSLVALEGAMMSKLLILSENIGAKYLLKNDQRWIFETDDIEDLSNKLSAAIHCKEELETIGKALREEYLRTSTFQIYKTKIQDMVKNNLVDDIDKYRVDHEEKALRECEERAKQEAALEPFYYFEIVPQKGENNVVYGAGEVGTAFTKLCTDNSIAFDWIDGDSEKWGIYKNGILIKSPDSVDYSDSKIYVAVYSQNTFREIETMLEQSIRVPAKIIWVRPELIRK